MITSIDDNLIYLRSEVEHTTHLVIVLKTLWGKKLFAKLGKYKFWLDRVSFLGHIISQGGISADHKKVDSVSKWNRLKNVF